MARNSLSVTDNRTGKQYEIPITDGTIPTMDLRQMKESEDDFGLMGYDPGFTNTASCEARSRSLMATREFSFIAAIRSINWLRNVAFWKLPTCCSTVNSRLTTSSRSGLRRSPITPRYKRGLVDLIESFPHDAYPMGMLMSTVAALATYYPESRDLTDDGNLRLQIYRLLAKTPTIAAYVYRHKMGMPFVPANNELSYAANFLSMVFGNNGSAYTAHPVLEKALDVLFVLHADHEQNCSTSAMRNVASSKPDIYSAVGAAIGALGGPLHGGANEAVLRMLQQIGAKNEVAAHVERVKKGEMRLMGFGHRVYKNYDPRAKIIKRLAHEVFEVTGINPLLEVALELESVALQDEYFVERKLYPNVDFYSGAIYQALGFQPNMFPVLFAIGRTAGWLAQWEEGLKDSEQRIARPRQIYEGHEPRDLSPGPSASISD